jgi:hypothetical protein
MFRAICLCGISAGLCIWLSLTPSAARAAPCDEALADGLLVFSDRKVPVEMTCDLVLNPNDVVLQPIAFSGAAASGSTLDCRGAILKGGGEGRRTVLIRSIKRRDGSWDAPRDITIRNCTIEGDLRIQGLGRNGEAEEVRLSSLEAGHTERAQSVAPSGITLSNIHFIAAGSIPLYAAPGVTRMTVKRSRFSGHTTATAIYLDAESANNRIAGNHFDLTTSWREMIAVDGSAHNRIENNTFEDPIKGGIFLYRNCGEGGTIRHQAPQGNVIAGNTFRYSWLLAARPAVWIGSRQGLSVFRAYCLSQPDRPFGSSLSIYDHAQNNVVVDNHLPGGTPRLIVDDDENNTVSNNH